MTLTVKKSSSPSTTIEGSRSDESGVVLVSSHHHHHHGLFSHFSLRRNHIKSKKNHSSHQDNDTKSKSRNILFRKKRNPKPDCAHIHQVPVHDHSSSSHDVEEERDHVEHDGCKDCVTPCNKSKSVSFQHLCIREYKLIIGDSPSCSEGPPTTLSWDHGDESIVSIDEYEGNREPRRSMSQMKISLEFRRDLLYQNVKGLSPCAIRRMERRMYKERNPAKLNNKFFATPH